MTNVTVNGWGIVVEMDHADVQAALLGLAGAGTTLAAAIGPGLAAANVAAPIVAAVVAAVTAFFALEALLIKTVDTGNGVFLTLPWPAALLGLIVLIIPTTRPPAATGSELPAPDWATRSTGSFGTTDKVDIIDYAIDKGVVGSDVVEFWLRIGTDNAQSSGWRKIVTMPDGQGSQWDIVADGRGSSASNGLWAQQVNNGQVLTFKKAKFLGIMTPVLQLGDLHNLVGGTRVTFTWRKDQ